MNVPSYQARRATLDDLPVLLALWRTEKLDVAVLEKRFTEFQVIVNPSGQLVGALGLQVAGTQGQIHSECFSDFGLADKLRPLLWERVQTVARNRGLTRLWLRGESFYFRSVGFDPVPTDLIEKLPAPFGKPNSEWWFLKLKDELLANLTPEQELALFKQLSDDTAQKMRRQARVVQWIAGLAVALVFIGLVIAGINIWRYHQHERRYGMPPSYRR